jgi:HEAT repeat protein
MIRPRSQRITRSRKKRTVPLSNLRTSEVVRAVVAHPRRLPELLNLLEDEDRTVRGRAAATLARLSESHTGRLVRVVDRLKDGLADESAYVRWSLSYALGRVGSIFPNKASRLLDGLSSLLEDENKVVRALACRALVRIAARKPQLVRDYFESSKREMPITVARSVKKSGLPVSKSANR